MCFSNMYREASGWSYDCERNESRMRGRSFLPPCVQHSRWLPKSSLHETWSVHWVAIGSSLQMERASSSAISTGTRHHQTTEGLRPFGSCPAMRQLDPIPSVATDNVIADVVILSSSAKQKRSRQTYLASVDQHAVIVF
jgi:hypothetical protein